MELQPGKPSAKTDEKKPETTATLESSKSEFEASDYPYDDRLKRKEYEKTKSLLQVELQKVQRWVQDENLRMVILCEGRDAAGKGGSIKRITEHLNPRYARVVALPKPTSIETGQWYFQRYVGYLPTYGEMVFYDRSWYNRGGVERVMGFCTPAEYLEFMRQTPELERMLARSGILLFKYWFSVSQAEQRRRFLSRRDDPLKRWKLSPIDLESVERWDEYTEAKESMFFYTDTADAPWTIIKSDDKKRARINCMRHLLSRLDYPGKDLSVVTKPDPLIVSSARNLIQSGKGLLSKAMPRPRPTRAPTAKAAAPTTKTAAPTAKAAAPTTKPRQAGKPKISS